jgi:hypothetical protein
MGKLGGDPILRVDRNFLFAAANSVSGHALDTDAGGHPGLI